MDQKTLKQIKAQLEAKKEELIKDLESVGSRSAGGTNNFDATFPDYDDSASIEDSALEVADYAKNLSLERDLEKELGDVEKSLKKIEAGTYGKCSHCGKAIEIERLKIRPESGSCVACKQKLKSGK
ncbi:MAG: TraR/DksA C4-type zinc finger protein [bacterium]